MASQQSPETLVGVSSASPDQPAHGAWRSVAVLTLLYWFGTLDRQIAALLVPQIKSSLALTDLEVSLIQGLAFGLFLMIASPITGWLVDRYSRRMVLFGGVVGWTCCAIASGLSRSFGQLFAARAGVGGFEATINPTAYSLLSDLFPPKKLALPLSIFVLGGNLGSAMSYLLGGAVIAWIASAPSWEMPMFGHLAGWQMAFVVTGIPGLVLAPLIWLAADPVRKGRSSTQSASATTFADLWRYASRHKAFYITHHLGFALIMAFIVGLQSWNATYFSRHFGWQLASIGYILGFAQLVTALTGLIFHGWAVDRMFGRGRRDAHLLYSMITSLLALPLGTLAYLVPSPVAAVILYNAAYFCVMAFASIGPASLQIATPPALRGKASAIYMVVLSIIATICAPMMVAAFTDLVFANEDHLGFSMAIFAALTAGASATLFAFCRNPMKVAAAEALGDTASAAHSHT